MRLFVAIEIDRTVRDRLRRAGEKLSGLLPKGAARWVEPENMHLTLVFLGQTGDDKLGEICRIVETAAAGHRAFDIDVAGVGVFGRPPRVVWAGMADCAALNALATDMQDAFVRAGWPREEREFSGHLTLCRIKNFQAGGNFCGEVGKMSNEKFGRCRIDSVVLFESRLSPTGPSYRSVLRAGLK